MTEQERGSLRFGDCVDLLAGSSPFDRCGVRYRLGETSGRWTDRPADGLAREVPTVRETERWRHALLSTAKKGQGT